MLRATLLLLLVLTAGCGTADEAPQRPLVDFQQSGSIRGLLDHLVVERDGQARLTTGFGEFEEVRRFRVASDKLRRLERTIAGARFDELEGSYLNETTVADDFQYEVASGGQTVRADGQALPDRLEPVLGVLKQIVEDQR